MTRYNPRLIKGRHSYTPDEVAKLFRIDKRTCFRWMREGLQPIEKNTKPLLIWGEELRSFLAKKAKKWKITLKENEFYCVKCRKAVNAKTGSIAEVPTGKKIGKKQRELICRRGKCEKCGTELKRFL